VESNHQHTSQNAVEESIDVLTGFPDRKKEKGSFAPGSISKRKPATCENGRRDGKIWR
jgi:hypothetical protein